MDMILLDEIRKSAKLSKLEMGRRLGISRQGYYQLEQDGSGPSLAVVLKLWHVARDELSWTADRYLKQLEKEL